MRGVEGVVKWVVGGIYLTPVRSSQLKNKSIHLYLREKKHCQHFALKT